jgi:hypothetical protein
MQTPRVERDAYGWFIGRRHDGSHAVDEGLRHELAAMQEVFAREWLAFGEGSVSVRPDQLGKLSQGTFYSPRFGRPVLNHLSAAQKRRQAKHARP